MAWISPTGATGWTDSANAIDEDTDTYASESTTYNSYTSNLVCTFTDISCDKVRIYFPSSTSDYYHRYYVSVGLDGVYTDIDDAKIFSGTWNTMYFTEQTIDTVRVKSRKSVDTASSTVNISEVEVNEKTAPTVTTDASPTSSDHESATLGGNVTADNDEDITERGIEYKVGSDGDPDSVSETDDDFGTGAFTLEVTGLDNSTEYYYRAYAINDSGTGYGDWKTFTTDDTTPTVVTLDCTNIGSTSVTANGNITNKGGATVITRGFCYKEGSTGDPTTADDTESEGAGAGDYDTGTYSLDITGLTPSTSYRIRAYAVNSEGTAYGDTITLTGYVFTEDADTYFTNFYNQCYIVNGEDDVVKYDGDYVSTVGITPPAAAPTGVGNGSGGSLGDGDYVFSYTYVDKDGYESNGSTTSDAISVRTIGTATIDGEGLDDATSGGTFSGESDIDYVVQIDGEGTPDTFKWSDDGGSTWDASTVNITGSAQDLNNGVTITFGATTGHTSGDKWEFTAAINTKIVLTIVNSDDPKVVYKNIYRSQIDDTELYYDGQVADNTTTTYTASKADTELGSLLHTDHTAPPSGCQLITKRKNRVLLASDDDLVISQLSDVEYFPAAWFMKTGLRQDITGMIEQMKNLPVFTENSIERLSGTDEDNFEFINTFSKKGCYAPRSVVSCDNLVVYLGLDGIYYFDGEITRSFSNKLNSYIKDNLNAEYIDKAAAAFHNGLYLLSYPKGSNTVNSETVYIDLINKTTGVYDYAFSCYSKWERFGDGNKLYGGDTSEGTVYEIDTYHIFELSFDDISPIACYDKTDFMDFGYPERWKQFYHIYIKVKSAADTKLTMYYTLDDNDEEEETIAIGSTTQWYKIDLAGGGQRGRAISLRPYVNGVTDVTFCGYMVVFDLEEEEFS